MYEFCKVALLQEQEEYDQEEETYDYHDEELFYDSDEDEEYERCD